MNFIRDESQQSQSKSQPQSQSNSNLGQEGQVVVGLDLDLTLGLISAHSDRQCQLPCQGQGLKTVSISRMSEDLEAHARVNDDEGNGEENGVGDGSSISCSSSSSSDEGTDSDTDTDSDEDESINWSDEDTDDNASGNETQTKARNEAEAANRIPIDPNMENIDSKEQQRKQLILVLLAQVCALHDSTPKTFIVHVLSLYESGILDDDSIRLLIDKGLVPSVPSIPSVESFSSPGSPPSGMNRSQSDINVYEHFHYEAEGDNGVHNVKDNTIEAEAFLEKVIHDGPDADEDQHEYEPPMSLAIVPTKSTKNQIIQTDSREIQVVQRQLQSQRQVQVQQVNVQTKVFGPKTIQESRAEKVKFYRSYLERNQAMNDWKNLNAATTTATGNVKLSSFGNHTPSWSAEHHPLYESRYERDFIQKKLLASGSFGEVFHALNKLDGCDYAVKRVVFSAKGYDTKQVEIIVREVQCLAKMGHENVVRYYTSWLESIWAPEDGMVGNGAGDDVGGGGGGGGHDEEDESVRSDYSFDAAIRPLQRPLLTLGPAQGDCPLRIKDKDHGDDIHDWDQHQPPLRIRQDSISTGGYGESDSNDCSAWTMNESRTQNCNKDYREWTIPIDESSTERFGATSKFNSHPYQRQNSRGAFKSHHQPQKKQEKLFRYRICLFIQMQLCKPATLADWIMNRNSSKLLMSTQHKLYQDASAIFMQISRGLAHVHLRNIVHRDLKPANIFHSTEDDCFKIGDFGLSKVLRSANGGMVFEQKSNAIVPLYNSRNTNTIDQIDLLTAGVGTSSYAAPEQLSSQTYGSEADIFSLGLILLELFSIFDSAHERAKTFQECRQGVLPPWLDASSALKNVGRLVLACTKPRAKERPTASDILKYNLFGSSDVADMQATTIKKMENQLEKKDEEIERLRRIIENQAAQIENITVAESERTLRALTRQ